MITSFSNPKVKAIRKLEDKKYRSTSGEFFIEGLRTVGEAIQTSAPIQSLVVAPELLVSEFGRSLLEHPTVTAVEKVEVSGEIFEKIAHKQGPQGIGAVVKQSWQSLKTLSINPTDLWVALDQIADPGNLGTIMRTADGVGCRGIITLGASTDPYDPNAVKASMGSIFSLELIQSDWGSFRSWQVEHKLGLVGTSDRAPSDYQAVNYALPLVLLMGSERHGLPGEMIDACDALVRIPMRGRADSLNLAVATAVVLYEIYNQTRKLDTIKP
ncbi:MAG: RNA methyltransferase [Brevefilum sp.]|nr:RNA methyltransferase [Brevefilum sp.]